MKNPKVSVIIPVYNTEAYVREALESIKQQTLQGIEIIVVDDGSTDNSLTIVESAIQDDSRVTVYSQTNQGPSGARNKGLEYAKGEFIYFMDSDDLLEKNALGICYNTCCKDNLDFAFFDAECINLNNNCFRQDYVHKQDRGYEIKKGMDILNDQLESHTLRTPVWLNFIRTAYLKQYSLSFPPGIIHEDELFCFLLYIRAQRVTYIPHTFFKRRLREDSIMNQKFSRKNVTGYFTVANELLGFSKEQSVEIRQTTDKYLTSMLNAVLWKAHSLTFSDKWYILGQCRKNGYFKYIRLKNVAVLLLK